MKNRGGILAAFIVIAIFVFLAMFAGFALYRPEGLNTSTPFSVVNVIRGEVLVLKKGSLSWDKASDGMALEPGSRIRTPDGTLAVLTFTQGTTTKLEPGTDLIIDKIEENQDDRPYAIVLKQEAGSTWNQVDKTGEKNFQIKTGSAEINVHGTLFSTEVDKSGLTTVKTTEGCVSVSGGGAEVQVLAGMMTSVKPHEAPLVPCAIPAPRNQLVITINQPAFGLVKDPDGASTGFLNSASMVNQISGSTISVTETASQTIAIPEPGQGDYTLSLHGIADGSGEIGIEGFIDGKRAFFHVESCNFTAAKETLLKLHYNILEGLLQHDGAAPVAAAEIPDESPTTTAPAPATAVPTADEKEPAKESGVGFTWPDNLGASPSAHLVTIVPIVIIAGVMFIIMRRGG